MAHEPRTRRARAGRVPTRAAIGCFCRWGDALFELGDAALCAPGAVASVPALSLGAGFRRSTAASTRPSPWSRSTRSGCAACSWRTDRRAGRWSSPSTPRPGTAVTPSAAPSGASTTRPPSTRPASPSWPAGATSGSASSLGPDSWTAPLDALRIAPAEDADAPPPSIRSVVSSDCSRTTDEVPLFVFDAGYDPIALGHGLADVRGEVLCASATTASSTPILRLAPTDRRERRTSSSPRAALQVLGAERPGRSPTRASSPRSPLRHGHASRPGTACTRGSSAADTGPATTRAADRARQRDPGRRRASPKPTSRTKKTLWLWWSGPGAPDLDLCWRAYLRRFDIEHTFRFVKNTLGWTTPSLHTPEQADRWTWLVVAAYTQLRLARGLVDDLRLPWERPRDPTQLTPARVRRGFRRLRATLGTPASPPKSTTPVRDGRKAPENRPERAIRRSKRRLTGG